MLFICVVLAIVVGLFYSAKSAKKGVSKHTPRLAIDTPENTAISNTEHTFGIDISHYQGKINWDKVKTSSHPIEYVFVRATMGKNRKDSKFLENWKNAQKHNYVRGAYHYYRPSENSTKQFNNFKSVVKIRNWRFYTHTRYRKGKYFWKKKSKKRNFKLVEIGRDSIWGKTYDLHRFIFLQ